MSELDVTLQIGGVYATARDCVIRTVLGSCIATCLYDPFVNVGGMNHFMLPMADQSRDTKEITRYGLEAMQALIESIERLGGRRERILAKLFGAGHVLPTLATADSVPARNIAFALRYLEAENMHIVSQDLGGNQARLVHFYPHSGKALVKRFAGAPNFEALP